jgi:DNA (cytosine-5)-methyltransferase 1
MVTRDPAQPTLFDPCPEHGKPKAAEARASKKTRMAPGRAGDVPRTFRVASLFSGIGGFEVGLAHAGHTTELMCEVWEPALAVLRERFPSVPICTDVRDLGNSGSTALPASVNLLTAGFPCTDLSQAGGTAGLDGENSGLVRQVFRILEERQQVGSPVPWVVIENVPFMLQLSKGKAMEVIVSELERLGYMWAYRVVNSLAFGVPQRRRRVILVASTEGDPRDVLLVDDAGDPPDPDRDTWRTRACGFYWTEGVRGLGWADDSVPTLKGGSTVGIPSGPAIVLPSGLVGKPDITDAERMQGFPAGWTARAESVARRGHRWKLIGNAVTVEMARWLGERLAKPGRFEGAGASLPRRGAWPSVAWNVDGHRRTAELSEYPLRATREPLAEWLRSPLEPLSERATAGFLSRATSEACKLHFPEGFLDALRAHLASVRARAVLAAEGAPPDLVPAARQKPAPRPAASSAAAEARMKRQAQAGTKPELAVRKAVRQLGQSYRVNRTDLAGAPDLSNSKHKWAIFVSGCYWHQHEGCRAATVPKENRDWWVRKFARNRERDVEKVAKLEALGYRVSVVWECETHDPRALRYRIATLLAPVAP